MTVYYVLTTVLSLINLIILVYTYENKKANYYFMLSMVVMALSNCGYLATALATNLNEAILAYKISYLGGCFIPLITFFLICTICQIRVPSWCRYILYAFSFGVYLLVCTVGYSDLYYRDVSLGKLGDATLLVHTYGVGHHFFYAILYGYLIAEVIILGYHLVKNRKVSKNKLWVLSWMVVLNIASFIIGRMIHKDLEIMPALYVLDGWILLYLQKRNMIFNLEDSVAATLRKQEIYGYIIFDNSLKYMSCNKVAQTVFPEITDCVPDSQIDSDKNLAIISEWLQKYRDDGVDKHQYETQGCYYEIKISNVWYRDKIQGYVLEIKDETDRFKYMKLLANYNSELLTKVKEQTGELREQQKQIQILFTQTITALSEAVDAKDRYTSGHSKRVAEYAKMIAERMGKDKAEQEEIYRAGLLHDVGKIRIPVEIINKAGKLTDAEYNTIKVHPVTGYHILSGISGSEKMAIAAKYHHERYDGKGYPNGLAGDKIPEVARILGVADAYDAMTSNRSYRSGLPKEVVREEIIKGRGTQFDPEIADIMLQLMEEDTEFKMCQSATAQKKVLVVDDNDMDHKVLSKIMEDEPEYELSFVKGGQEALKELNRNHFDLILLDVMMPDMDGLETLKHLRKIHKTPVVLMTGNKNLDTSSDFAAYGCNDYITKPFQPLLVKEVVYNTTERVKNAK